MKPSKPSFKQKQFAKEYIKNKFNAQKAALQVYDVKPNLAKQLGHNTLKNPMVQNEIQKGLAKAGLTPEYINESMYEAIEINKQGKPSQAVLAQLLTQAQKIYQYIPKDRKEVIREERRVLLSKDFSVLKTELTTSVSTSQELLEDL